MLVSKSKLTGLVLVFLMTSGVYAYANNGKGGTVSPPDSLAMKEVSQKNLEIVKKVKECIGVEDIRILQTKKIEILQTWRHAEAKDENRVITMRLIKETGTYIAMSMPKTEKWGKMAEAKKPKRKEIKAVFKEEQPANSEIFKKIQICLEAEAKDIRIIETKDANILEAWVKEESKDATIHAITTNPNNTGTWTGTSMPKGR